MKISSCCGFQHFQIRVAYDGDIKSKPLLQICGIQKLFLKTSGQLAQFDKLLSMDFKASQFRGLQRISNLSSKPI